MASVNQIKLSFECIGNQKLEITPIIIIKIIMNKLFLKSIQFVFNNKIIPKFGFKSTVIVTVQLLCLIRNITLYEF